MESFQFNALGTAWSISIDQADFDKAHESELALLWKNVVDLTAEFENRFSRFKEGSESRQFVSAKAGTYPISSQLKELLAVAETLHTLTDGAYDPAVGGLMEAAGYTPDYQLKPDTEKLAKWHLPQWSLKPAASEVVIDGPLLFDFGGMGKGYWIDQLSALLTQNRFPFHLVEGGGDMFATTKHDGEGWNIAIEYPGQKDMALGTYVLENQGLAASDVFKRRWGNWHHFLDVTLKQPTHHISGCVAVTSSAWKADQITSILALSDPSHFQERVAKIGGEYVALLANGRAEISPGWSGELF